MPLAAKVRRQMRIRTGKVQYLIPLSLHKGRNIFESVSSTVIQTLMMLHMHIIYQDASNAIMRIQRQGQNSVNI
jgi:hypothetical protein